MIRKKSLYRELLLLFISFVAFLISFPKFVPDYGVGLDPSYVWALNYLINFDYQSLISLIYPIGPLGFLKYAAAYENNLAIALVFFSVVKISFLYLVLKLGYELKNRITIVHFLIAVVIGYFSGVDFSIIGSTAVLLLLFYRFPIKYQYFLFANIFAIVGLLIKSSIGIAAYSSIFTCLLIGLLSRSMSLKKLVSLSGISLFVFLVIGILVFQGFTSFWDFLNGMLHLAGAYSSGLALFPENNWWLLSGFILTIISFPFIVRNKNNRIAFFILLLPLFAMWKHAMGREDIYHAQLLIGFLVVFWGIIIVDAKKYKLWLLVFPLVSISLFALNLNQVFPNFNYPIKLNGISNFNESVVHFKSFNEKYEAVSLENIKVNETTSGLKKLIGEKRVDVYPWDLSYIPANDFAWKPRKTLELGASTSKWLTNKSAEQFQGDNAPDFVIFQLNSDKWGSRYGSLDGRYLLNDEPMVVYNILNNYQLKTNEKRILLFEKSGKRNIKSKQITGEQTTSWGEWVKVPESVEVITRLRFENEKTMLGSLKSFLYKGEACFIDYRLKNGKTIGYRFLASNAQDGLWINPLIFDPEDENIAEEVAQIRFRCTNEQMMKSEIFLKWETLELDGYKSIDRFFKNRNALNQKSFTTIYEYNLTPDESTSLSANSFSKSYKNALEELWPDHAEILKIETEVRYKFKTQNSDDVVLVISTKDSEEDFWISTPLIDDQNKDEWKYAYLEKTLYPENHKSGLISIYVWNNGGGEVLIDDFKITIKVKNR